jgi:hypothetical protein
MNAGGQNLVSGHEIRFYNASGTLASTFTFPSNVGASGLGSSILIATQEFADNSTVAPNFLFEGNTDPDMMGADTAHPVPVGSGKIAFSPGFDNCTFGGPMVVDSVAYGTAYTGSVDYGGKFASDLPTAGTNALIVGNLALEPSNNSTEYSLQDLPFPAPINTAGGTANTPRNNSGTTGVVATVRIGDEWFCPPTDAGCMATDADDIDVTTNVSAGDTVIWEWGVGGGGTTNSHTTTHCADNLDDCNGPREWDSGNVLQDDGTFAHTFQAEDAGETFLYRCQVHPSTMRGRVIVASDGTPQPVGGFSEREGAGEPPRQTSGPSGGASLPYVVAGVAAAAIALAAGGLHVWRRRLP